MATNTTGVVNLDDQEHPHFHLTKRNYETSLFWRLPMELRLTIYEYAVYEENAIDPSTTCDHSNKFHHYIVGWKQRYEPPTVVPLSYTCRAIYAELQYYCPFYKVNTFTFQEPYILIKYLVAITPQRRNNIWWIDLRPSMGTHVPLWSFDQLKHRSCRDISNDEILALLSQCGGLQKHELRLNQYLTDYKVRNPLAVLLRCLTWAMDPLAIEEATTGHSMWSLPFFRVRFIAGEPTSPIFARLISTIDDTLSAYRQRIGDSPQWFLDMAKDSRLLDSAAKIADLYFTGEERIAQDKAGSLRGPPSSRTRSKCQAVYDNLGTPVRVVPKYNEEGILTVTPDTKYLFIRQIRWGKPDVRCEVLWTQGPNKGKTSWEDLSVFLAPQWRGRLLCFYTGMLRGAKDLSLQKMQDTPSPRDIVEFEGANSLGFRVDAKGKPRITLEWKRLMKQWDTQRSRKEIQARNERLYFAKRAKFTSLMTASKYRTRGK
ncbi:hypothetical protein F4776DRAFT_674796 [Hypoxylon sp. NC0597]|nr:hypothetical protein F4776DRAFT_674796 [Hypoxylon sp. NC0597]